VKVDGDAVAIGVVDAPAQQEEPVSAVAEVFLGFLARYSAVEILHSLWRSCDSRSLRPTVDHCRHCLIHVQQIIEVQSQ